MELVVGHYLLKGIIKNWKPIFYINKNETINKMFDIEFQKFPKMGRLDQVYMTITQKIHGTNAQIVIKDGEIRTGCRTRYLDASKDNDNFGFDAFVQENKQEFIDKLGNGRFYGEWAGPG